MRNGLNISSVSELVHEIRSHREEALIRLGGRCRSPIVDLSMVRIETLHGGTIRVARDFPFEVHAPNRVPRGAPSPLEFAVAALGGCVLVTYIQGATARGITVTRLEVDVQADLITAEGAPRGLTNVAYTIRVDGDAEREHLIGVANHVSCLSPNHRTFVDPNTLAVNVHRVDASGNTLESVFGIGGHDASRAPAAAKPTAPTRLRGTLSWSYGTQMKATCSTDEVKARCPTFGMDQPKQYLGLDTAPNPQEYLLSAMAAELSQSLAIAAAERRLALGDIEVRCTGTIDMQGITYVNPEAPVKVHDIVMDVFTESSLPLSEVQGLIASCCARSALQATVCQPSRILVSLEHAGTQLAEFVSDRQQIEGCLVMIANAARQFMEAQAAKAAGTSR